MAMTMMSGLSEMESKYSRKEMIAALEKFKALHVKEYSDAVDVFREDVAEKIKLLAKKAKTADFKKFDVAHNLGLVTPVDCTKGYDGIISVLSSSKDDEISLSLSEANMIFNNDWDWAQAASTSNAFYSSRKM